MREWEPTGRCYAATAKGARRMEMDAKQIVENIRGGEEWWRDEGREVYERLADKLLKAGLADSTVESLLSSAFNAAAGEFGG